MCSIDSRFIARDNRDMMPKRGYTGFHAATWLAVVLILLLAGCNMSDSDNVTYVVIPAGAETPSGEITQSPPTQMPSPTPDIAPDIILQVADRDLRDGYYESAIAFYRSILDRTDASADIQAGAAFGMGKAALRGGYFQEALDALSILITSYPEDYRAVQAYFLRGDAYLGLSQWQLAIDDLQQYLRLRSGLIDSYAHERIGDAQLALGQYDAALGSYTLAADSSRSLVPQLILREKIAQLHTLNGQVNLAIEQYDSILSVATIPAYRAEIDFLAAQAQINSGDLQNGLERMERIFDQYEDHDEAFQAMTILLQNGRIPNSYAQGEVSYYAGDYAGAIAAFNTFTSQAALAQIPPELHLMLGRAYRAVGNWQAALVAFNTLIEQHPTDPLFGDALLETGRTHFLNNDHDTAIARYLEIANTYTNLAPTAAEALWRAGYLYGVNGNLEQSRTVFLQLADTYPGTDESVSGLFIAASAAMNAGDTSGAESLYARLAATSTGDDQASAYLNLGRLALERGDQAAANDAFSQVTTASADSYYSARAQDILAGRQPFAPPNQFVFEFDDLAEITEAENWLRSSFGLVQDGPLWPLSPELEADPRIVRGRELYDVGAFEEANEEFYEVLDDYETDALASYQLAIFFRIIEAYTPSMVGAANVIRAADTSTLGAPEYIARMRFPAYYRDEVLRITDQYDIDPLLMLSLIRHESLFNTYATAAAGEKGLTQVIPSTGDYIAGQLEWPNYQHRDLFRPYAGIEFGAFYLAEQLNRFDGNAYVALSGYNAGPGRAYDWSQLAGDDLDRYMSTITIDSVQIYIQRIYNYYNVYRALYGAAQ